MRRVTIAIGLIFLAGIAAMTATVFTPQESSVPKRAKRPPSAPGMIPIPLSDENGDYAYLVDYQLAYVPATDDEEAQLVAVLSNTSDQSMAIMINSKRLHASFHFTRPDGTKIEAYPSQYYRMMMTAQWIDPPCQLDPLDQIIWRIPLSDLVPHLTKIDGPLTEETIAGSKVQSEIGLSVVPGPGISIPYEKVKSDPITIPGGDRQR
ncbi:MULTISPECIES: hypothetical protein [Pirellulaceae]|uniref:hypothetical protein n=1 Tax=Pirellulaceae TaxID=2691357 RepID=UPI0011B03E1D|nr:MULTISPECIES: hypothetical protein [Pirellulaceae]